MTPSTFHRRETQPLRICVIGSTYPRHHGDYAVPWLRESVNRLAIRGHQVIVLAPSFEGLTSHVIDGVPVVRFRYSPKCWERLTHEQGAPNRIQNPLYQLLGLPYVLSGRRTAKRLSMGHPFDIVHVHWPFPHEVIGFAAARVNRAPLIVTSHGAEFALARRKRWVQVCLKRSLQRADALIANSLDTARKTRELSGRHCEVVPFGSTVQPRRVDFRTSHGARVLFTGRLIQRKGVEYLIQAIPHILEQRPDATFVITGNGDQRDRLIALTRHMGLEHVVDFLGFVSNERLTDEYARCNVWVNPSIVDDRGDTEGLGVGAIEAFAHGKPVVATAVGGIPDVVVHGITGLLVPEKDPLALAQAILRMLNDPVTARRMADAGMRRAHNQFDWELITDRLEAIYRRSLWERTGGRPYETHPPEYSVAGCRHCES